MTKEYRLEEYLRETNKLYHTQKHMQYIFQEQV